MDGYIKRSSIMDRFTFENGDTIPEECENDEVNTISFADAKRIIREIPLEDVAPVVHGKWYFADDSVFRCSVCGRICYEDDAPYCYCGAKMDAE